MREIKFRAWDAQQKYMIEWEWFQGKDQFGLGKAKDFFDQGLRNYTIRS